MHFDHSRGLAALLLVVPPCFGQSAPGNVQQPPAISVRVDLVRVAVTATDAKGNFVRNLTRDDFRLLDEGAEQTLDYFAAVEEPARVLVLLESSPAVYLIREQHLLAAHLLFSSLAADDEVALATYSNEARLRANFSTDKGAAHQALVSPQFSLGDSRLHFMESLATAVEWLSATPGKKSMVLLSTGLDDGRAPTRWESLEQTLRSTDVMIFTVALGGSLRETPSRKKKPATNEKSDFEAAFEQASAVLRNISEITGGRAFFPRTGKDFEAAYRQIGAAVRNQYHLGFNAAVRDGRYRKIEVQLLNGAAGDPGKKGRMNLRISARPGYVAPQP